MDHLDEITVEDLETALDNVDGKKPTQRLLATIAYKNGVTQTELAECYVVERKTIYNWLTPLEEASLQEAVEDAYRSGRNRKLSENQLKEVQRTVHESPREAGYDGPAWTTNLVQQHLAETYIRCGVPASQLPAIAQGSGAELPETPSIERECRSGGLRAVRRRAQKSTKNWTPP